MSLNHATQTSTQHCRRKCVKKWSASVDQQIVRYGIVYSSVVKKYYVCLTAKNITIFVVCVTWKQVSNIVRMSLSLSTPLSSTLTFPLLSVFFQWKHANSKLSSTVNTKNSTLLKATLLASMSFKNQLKVVNSKKFTMKNESKLNSKTAFDPFFTFPHLSSILFQFFNKSAYIIPLNS